MAVRRVGEANAHDDATGFPCGLHGRIEAPADLERRPRLFQLSSGLQVPKSSPDENTNVPALRIFDTHNQLIMDTDFRYGLCKGAGGCRYGVSVALSPFSACAIRGGSQKIVTVSVCEGVMTRDATLRSLV